MSEKKSVSVSFFEAITNDLVKVTVSRRSEKNGAAAAGGFGFGFGFGLSEDIGFLEISGSKAF